MLLMAKCPFHWDKDSKKFIYNLQTLKTMNTPAEFTLIDGTFDLLDAKDLILGLIDHKIRFHSMKNFGTKVRLGENDDHSEKRLEALKAWRVKLLEMVAEAEKNNPQWSIHSAISIHTAE